MSDKYPAAVLWVCAIVFLVIGVLFAAMTQDLFAPLGIAVPDGAPLTELRAVYGGLELGVGVFLLLCARRGGEAIELGLVLSLLLMSGLAWFRGIGIVVDEPQVPMMYGLLIAEVTGAVFALSGLVILSKSRANAGLP